jgi:uncharacterized protein YdeI (YjbR/CyaY-like superfamily)
MPLYVENRTQWRKWLAENHGKCKEVWLLYYRKGSGKARIPYNDAVEEALCFGWIDSLVKKLDAERFIQKFTPRKSGSIWAESNIRRAKRLIAQGRMTPAGLILYKEVASGKAKRAPKRAPLPIPVDLRTALAKKRNALQNFRSFAPSHRNMYLWWIADAKRHETRLRRIERVVLFALKNRKPGMM